MKEKIFVLAVSSFILGAVYSTEAQQPAKQIPRIGFISPSGSPTIPSRLFDSFRQGLRDLGYVEGQNILIERRYAEGRLDRLPDLAADTHLLFEWHHTTFVTYLRLCCRWGGFPGLERARRSR